MKPIEWRPSARQDVADEAYWYACRGGLVLGERFIAAVDAVLARLSEFPSSGSLRHADVVDGASGPLRFSVVSSFDRYLVYYFDLPSSIQIVRVWDASRGLDDLLGSDE